MPPHYALKDLSGPCWEIFSNHRVDENKTQPRPVNGLLKAVIHQVWIFRAEQLIEGRSHPLRGIQLVLLSDVTRN